ncbi:glycosyltransferase family 9 protein [Pedobacter sp. SYSU D00535]|uniref:glycosyltransferase family 9 protein n=1 Tax=Pedobacter sp. SYSU D00535 TaxID=2810308 RepID=UPI001A96924C|nr:glycosyltransferase family 9 protein [Pedobacter sp. SYSU D00535]
MELSDWKNCRNILVIRPDNMGDLLMSTPAIRALKETTGARIAVLSSSMSAGIAKMIPEIDEAIIFDLPWVKTSRSVSPESFQEVVELLKQRKFDAAVVFTVYSQNPLPTVMLPYLAGIPLRLAYCRENPYELLTHWVPDQEPYSLIKHQVRRDLDLVAAVGAHTADERLSLRVNEGLAKALDAKLAGLSIDLNQPWIMLHPGVSEKKREYPAAHWIELGKILSADYQLLLTGGPSEKSLTQELAAGIGERAFSLAGMLSLEEFTLLIKRAPLVISVNTGTIHIAAACGTPVVVLYAFTNPQHSPWKVPGKVLPFSVQEELKSRNEVIRYVSDGLLFDIPLMVSPEEVAEAARQVLSGNCDVIPEMIPYQEKEMIG